MCGRYALIVDAIELLNQCGQTFSNKQITSNLERTDKNDQKASTIKDNVINYNVSPTAMMPVLFSPDDSNPKQLRLELMHWGLIPSWSTEDKPMKKYSTINARIENVLHNKLWNRAKFRCLVPISGYYEWLAYKDKNEITNRTKNTKRPKQPYYVTRNVNEQEEALKQEYVKQEDIKEEIIKEEYNGINSSKLIFLAGLYSYNKQLDQYSFTIITGPSQDPIKWLHDRMPCMVNPNSQNVQDWLDSNVQDWTQPKLNEILLYEDDNELNVYPVDPRVGNVHNHGSELIKPFAVDRPQSTTPVKTEDKKASVKREDVKSQAPKGGNSDTKPRSTTSKTPVSKRLRSQGNVLEMLQGKRAKR